MNRVTSHLDEVNLIGKLADLKEQHYHNALVLSALIELLVEKGVLHPREIEEKAAQLDGLIPR